jgi:superfamily II DNA or RNA helicase
MNSRYKTFKEFNKYYQKKDNRSMEELCNSNDGEFKLQVQQNFLKEYMIKNPEWKRLLLYHEIGSGKTCSAITMAEEFLKLNPLNKVTIILPARLKTNMFDELISPCGFNKYISREDFILYYDSNVSSSVKKNIKKKFMTKINENYNIMSFEKFRINMMKHKKNIVEFLRNFTKNNMIIVDEVHNLFSIGYNKMIYDNIIKKGAILSNYKGLNTILLKLLSKYCHDSCKMILLTATPMFHKFDEIIYYFNLFLWNERKLDKTTTIKPSSILN